MINGVKRATVRSRVAAARQAIAAPVERHGVAPSAAPPRGLIVRSASRP
jgi:hypothetical protein